MTDICDTCVHFPPSTFGGKPCSFCDPLNPEMTAYARREEPIQTNADRIRSMTDDELAEFIGGIFTIECDIWGDYDPRLVVTQQPRVETRSKEDIMNWLQSPAEGGDTT